MEVDKEDVDYLTNRSCDDYFNGKSLIGTPESCAVVLERPVALGVNVKSAASSISGLSRRTLSGAWDWLRNC